MLSAEVGAMATGVQIACSPTRRTSSQGRREERQQRLLQSATVPWQELQDCLAESRLVQGHIAATENFLQRARKHAERA